MQNPFNENQKEIHKYYYMYIHVQMQKKIPSKKIPE